MMPPATPVRHLTARHLIVPFAAASSSGCQRLQGELGLQHLPALLNQMQAEPPWQGDEYSYSPPHEQVHAQALGWPETLQQDGQMPWAALLARQLALSGHDAGHSADDAWAMLTPCHWQIHADHATMAHPAELALTPAETDALLATIQPWLEQDGLQLLPLPASHTHQTGMVQWLMRGPLLQGLRAASLDRVCGRHVQHWHEPAAQPPALRRLHSELQMLLYTHPVNDARTARHALPVNALWISDAGSLPAILPAPAAAPELLRALAAPALREDWPAWRTAWQALDAEVFAPLLQQHRAGQTPAQQITLCSERRAATWRSSPSSLLQRTLRRLRPLQLPAILQAL